MIIVPEVKLTSFLCTMAITFAVFIFDLSGYSICLHFLFLGDFVDIICSVVQFFFIAAWFALELIKRHYVIRNFFKIIQW